MNDCTIMPIIVDANKGKLGTKTNKYCKKENEELINRIIERKNTLRK